MSGAPELLAGQEEGLEVAALSLIVNAGHTSHGGVLAGAEDAAAAFSRRWARSSLLGLLSRPCGRCTTPGYLTPLYTTSMSTTAPSLLEVQTVITTHQNADFDALAAAVGASLLYPDGRIVFAGSLNPNVREFVTLHGENLPIVNLRLLDQSKIRQLIIVDTADTERIGDLGRLCGKPGVEVVVFDHHESEKPERPAFVKGENWVISHDGAQATSMLHLLREREVEIPRLAATIFALGIHEDTGSLTYPRTTIRDAEMLAAAMRLGASQPLIERYLHSALTADQRVVLMQMVDLVRLERVRGLDIHTVALDVPTLCGRAQRHRPQAHGAHQRRGAAAGRGHGGPGVRHRPLPGRLGGRGRAAPHARRWRARPGGFGRGARQDRPGDHRRAARSSSSQSNLGAPTAGEIMSRPVRLIDADTPVTDALVTAQRYGHSGICVREDGRVVGIVARRDLDKALRHGLGHAPVKGVMTQEHRLRQGVRPPWTSCGASWWPATPAGCPWSPTRPTTRRCGSGSAKVGDVVGIVTRTDVLAAYHGRWEEEQSEMAAPQLYAMQALADHPFFGRLFRACSALSEDFPGVYLVGGFVRDLLLDQPNADVDIAVEGDGIEFAARLAARTGRPGARPPQVQDRGGAAAARRPGGGAGLGAHLRGALPRRRGHHPHRVLRLSGGAAEGGARLHPPGPVPPRFHHQRHGHLAERRGLRHGHRLLRRATATCATA